MSGAIERLSYPKPFPIQPRAQAGEPAKEAQDLRERYRTDFAGFMQHFFPLHFWGAYSPMHLDLIQQERKPDRRGKREVIAAPRGNAKTVFKVLAKVIHSLVYGYHPFTVIIGYSAQEAEGKVKDIRDELLFNEELVRVYGKQLAKGAGTQSFITTQGCMVLARGRGGQVRGLRHGRFRPTHIICDDVEDLEACQSPIQRQKTIDWFKKDVLPAGQSGEEFEADISFIGTILHEDSLLACLLKDPAWIRKKYKAIISHSERPDLWEECRRIFADLDTPDEEREDTVKAFYEANKAELLKGVEVLWPDGQSYFKLMQFLWSLGPAAFNSEYQNDPHDPTRQILHPENCVRFKTLFPDSPDWPQDEDRRGFIVRCAGKDIHSNNLHVVAFHDPALAEKDTSDYAAVVVCGQDDAGWIYVLDCWLKKEPPDKQIRTVFDLYQKWDIRTLYLETNHFQALLKPLYNLEAERLQAAGTPISLKVVGVNQHSNKIHRISTLEPYFSNAWIRLNERIDTVLIDQLRLFPTADHDDGPDALHGCVDRLRKPAAIVKVAKEGEFLK